jgi:glc operon protein GlcG
MQRQLAFGCRVLTALLVWSIPCAATAGGPVASKQALTLEGARHVISIAKAEAARLGAPGGVIAVVDDGGSLFALERLDGTFAAGSNVSVGKARTAALFKKPTKFFEDVVNKGRTAMTALPDFTPLQGGVPIEVNGQVVGAIGVSGAASAQQDEDIALAGAAAAQAFASSSGSSSSSAKADGDATLYFDSEEVSSAFSKGAVLYDGNGGRNYMVHASRREKPGQAEVHALDTDVIYVLDGTATFVTGGQLVAGKNVEPGEIRGPSIDGGTARTLAKGDVVVVPSGTPHWFEKVGSVFTYFVVKVR